VLDQPAPHGGPAHRHDHVVDRAAVRVLDLLDPVERQLPEREATVRGDAAVERGVGRDEVVAPDDAAAARDRALHRAGQAAGGLHPRDVRQRRDLVDVRERARQRAREPQRVARQAEQAAAEHLELAGVLVGGGR